MNTYPQDEKGWLRSIPSREQEPTRMNTVKIELTEEESILVRDAMLDMKHNLKASPSERGQRLCKLSAAIAESLDNKINHRRY